MAKENSTDCFCRFTDAVKKSRKNIDDGEIRAKTSRKMGTELRKNERISFYRYDTIDI